MGQRGSISLIAEEIKSRFEWNVPKFHLLHELWFVYRSWCHFLWNFQLVQEDLFLTGVTATLWISSVSGETTVPGNLPLFCLWRGLQHITTPSGFIGFLSEPKLCIKLHLAVYTVLYCYIHTKDIFIIFITLYLYLTSNFHRATFSVSLLCFCVVATTSIFAITAAYRFVVNCRQISGPHLL